jgi:excisionase family DNA binding protein
MKHKPPTPADPDAGISTTLAADLLGCSPRQVRRLIDRKQLDGYRLGPRDWRTTRRACREFQQRGGVTDGGDQ